MSKLTSRQQARLKSWYKFNEGIPCDRCGTSRKVENAHFKLLDSEKTGEPLNRRSGENAFVTLRLCRECHRTGEDSVHEVGEEKFLVWWYAEETGWDYESIAPRKWGAEMVTLKIPFAYLWAFKKWARRFVQWGMSG